MSKYALISLEIYILIHILLIKVVFNFQIAEFFLDILLIISNNIVVVREFQSYHWVIKNLDICYNECAMCIWKSYIL